MRALVPASVISLIVVLSAARGGTEVPPYASEVPPRAPYVQANAAATANERADVISGLVTDAAGKGMHRATVELLRAGQVIATVTTNARGQFSFKKVEKGVYEVRASSKGLVPAAVHVVVNDLPSPPIHLSLGVRADVTDHHMRPAARAGAKAGNGGIIVGVGRGTGQAPPPQAASPVGGVAETVRMAMPHHVPDFNTEAYDHIVDNGYRRVSDSPLSTFSIDVDTASYSNVRRFLNQGTLPPPDAVRVEELINYFRFTYPDGPRDVPFSVTTEVAPCPWKPRHRLALIGLQATREQHTQLPARNLVFLLDVSGSMMPPDKLPLVRTAMRMLADTLTARDRVAIVVYAGASGLVLPSTPGDRKAEIDRAISELEAGGSTNGAAGIQLAYDTAAASFIKGGVNRVILATDGDFNVGVTSQGELIRLIEQQRERGIFLSVLGVGTGNLKDSTMEKLADKGNGNYAYLDSLHEARRVLIAEAGSTLVTVAKDVKIQVEFNPATVAAYRLIGYENRLLNREDFNDDKKDAGEIGAGHTVTALYELIPPGEPVEGGTVDPLRYQDASRPSSSARSGELMTVKLRYKKPDADSSELLSAAVRDQARELTANLGFAAAVAQFGMLLRHSEFKGEASWSSAQQLARRFRGDDPDGYRAEFVRLVDLAAALEAQNKGTPPQTRR
jgi:Ca-activated chloride channel family protein